MNDKARAKDFDVENLEALEMTRKLNKDGRVSFPCLKMKQGDHEMFNIVARPSVIHNLFTVPHCDGESGYQRMLNEKRAKEIAAYLQNGMPIPGNIVIHIRLGANYEYNSKSKTITFDNAPGMLAIIDGQHRAWGAAMAGPDYQFAFTCFAELDQETEIGLFLDVNGKQKGVSSALVSRVKGFAGRENQTEQLISGLFDEFEKDENSALSGKLSALEAKQGFISHVAFMRSLKPVMRIARIKALEPGKRFELLNRIFRQGRLILGDDELFRALVFGGFTANIERIMTIAKTKHGSLKEPAIKQALSPLANFSRETAQTCARINKADITAHIRDLLGDTSSFSEDDI